jgi:hypothetical protein
MAHQRGAEALPLEFVCHSESYLGRSGLHDDLTSAADNLSVSFFHYCYQGNMVEEVGIQKECDFPFRKTASYTEETAVERLVTSAANRVDEAGSIVRSEGTDFNPTSIAQHFSRRKLGCFVHRLATLLLPSTRTWLRAAAPHLDSELSRLPRRKPMLRVRQRKLITLLGGAASRWPLNALGQLSEGV